MSFEKFEKLPKEKQQIILGIISREFYKEGYKGASTNKIVEEAGISKGTLFNYFGSKRKMFLYVFDYYSEYFKGDLCNCLEVFKEEDNIFDRMIKFSKKKLDDFEDNPSLFKFVFNVFINIPRELEDEIEERKRNIRKLISEEIYNEEVVKSSFREGIDNKKALNALETVVEGIFVKGLKETNGDLKTVLANKDKIYREMVSYVELFRDGFGRISY